MLNKGSGTSRQVYALYKLLEDIGHNVAKHLIAIHTLSGCDTTSKVGSKTELIGILYLIIPEF